MSDAQRIDGEWVLVFLQVKLGKLEVFDDSYTLETLEGPDYSYTLETLEGSDDLYTRWLKGLEEHEAFKDYDGVLKLTVNEKQTVLFRILGDIYYGLAKGLETSRKVVESTLKRSRSEEDLPASSKKAKDNDGVQVEVRGV